MSTAKEAVAMAELHENVAVDTVNFATHEKQETVWQCMKANPKVIMYSMASCMSALLWGYDVGVNGISTALPGFKLVFGYEYEGDLLLSALWNGLWVAMTSVGLLIGGITCGYVSDIIGRRWGIVAAAGISVIGVAVEYIAKTPQVLLAGKIVNGLGLGFFITLGPTYASEIAPLPLRAPLISTVSFFITAGQFLAIGVGNGRYPILTPDSYKLLFAIQWIFPGLIVLIALILPESPWYLVKRGQPELAAKSLARLHNSNYDVAAALREIEVAVEREREEYSEQRVASFLDCFRKSDWRRTRVACGMFLIQQITGIAFYAQGLYFLTIAGLELSLSFQLTLMGFGLGLVSNVLGWFLMTYYGRRPIIMVGIVLNGLLLIAIGIAGCFTGSKALLFIGIAVNLANLFYGPCVGATTWAVSAEVSSPRLRSKTQALCTVVNSATSWMFGFITPYLINTDEANLGGKAAFVWAGCCVLALLWAWFELPETKNRTFAELDELFLRKTATRKFASTQIIHEDEELK